MGAPVGDTCPSINEVQKALRRGKQDLRNAQVSLNNEDVDDAKSEIDDAIGYIDEAVGDLDKLRADNQSLRSWGHEQEARVAELEQEVAENVSEVDRLETMRVNILIVLTSKDSDAQKFATIEKMLAGTWASDHPNTLIETNAAGAVLATPQGASHE